MVSRWSALLIGILIIITLLQTFNQDKPEVVIPAEVYAGAEVTFHALYRYGEVDNVTWQMGDGTVAYGPTVTHMYALPGYVVLICTVKSKGRHWDLRYHIHVMNRTLTLGNVKSNYTARYEVSGGSILRENPSGIMEVGGYYFTGNMNITVYSLEAVVDSGGMLFQSQTTSLGQRQTLNTTMNVTLQATTNFGDYGLRGNICVDTCVRYGKYGTGRVMWGGYEEEIHTWAKSRFQGLAGTGSEFGTDDVITMYPTSHIGFNALDLSMFSHKVIGPGTSGTYSLDSGSSLHWQALRWVLTPLGPGMWITGYGIFPPDMGADMDYRFDAYVAEGYPTPVSFREYMVHISEGNRTAFNLSCELSDLSMDTVKGGKMNHEGGEKTAIGHGNGRGYGVGCGAKEDVNAAQTCGLYGMPIGPGDGSLNITDAFYMAVNASREVYDMVHTNGTYIQHASHSVQKDGAWRWQFRIVSPSRCVEVEVDESGSVTVKDTETDASVVPMDTAPCVNLSEAVAMLGEMGYDFSEVNTTLDMGYGPMGMTLVFYVGGDIPFATVFLPFEALGSGFTYHAFSRFDGGYREGVVDGINGRVLMERVHTEPAAFTFP